MKIKVIVNIEGFSMGWFVALKHLLSQKKRFLYGFNAKIGYKKYALSPEIFAKTSKIMLVWFDDLIYGMFSLISRTQCIYFKNNFAKLSSSWQSNLVKMN